MDMKKSLDLMEAVDPDPRGDFPDMRTTEQIADAERHFTAQQKDFMESIMGPISEREWEAWECLVFPPSSNTMESLVEHDEK